MKLFKEKMIKKFHDVLFIQKRKNLINKNFTIISNNCWAGHVYRDFDQKYQTPFIGLFIISPDYIKLLKNLDYYMSQDLKFIKKSKLDIGKSNFNREYPIGALDDIEIHFQHYESEKEAYEKWNRRIKRMNWDNLFIKFSEKFYCNEELLKEFDELPYRNKIVFTKKEYSELRNSIYFEKLSVTQEMYFYYKKFDIVKWLNSGKLKNR